MAQIKPGSSRAIAVVTCTLSLPATPRMRCVNAEACEPPAQTDSKTRPNYYDDPQFGDYPVIYVTSEMANAYCEWRGGYLPSEAQWEKPARGANGNIYSWGNDFMGNQVNFCDINCDLPIKNQEFDDGYKDTAPVGSYPDSTSPNGVYNLAGNVYEWVTHIYDPYPGGDPTASLYFGQGYRVIRGGSWASSIDTLRASNRDPSTATNANWDLGFSCARDATP